MPQNGLSIIDRFEILEQLNLHQQRIDSGFGIESARNYQELYWPEGKFHVHDLRTQTFEGLEGMKKMYDYAHSVFPIEKWFHTLGAFEITGSGDEGTAKWRWIVSWREDGIGTVSTGTYEDRFQRRGSVWKCLERTSRTDPNWPVDLFQNYIDNAEKTFRTS